VAARASEAERLRDLFAQDALRAWDPIPVDSFEEARFVLQHTTCDLVLVTEGLYQEGPEGLGWLARQREVPVVFLADAEPERITQAYQDGVNTWLPRGLTLANPHLLAATLERVVEWSSLRRGRHRAAESLQQCRRQIDRLVGILWRTVPMNTEQPWLAQRHMLERLQEEISRTQRHGVPLAMAIGEVHRAPALGELAQDEPVIADWTTQRILRAKRRCDVAGQYGLQGFMLLLVHTPQAGAVTCCRRFQHVLEAVPAIAGHGPHGPVRAYFGVASFSAATSSAKSLLSSAEQRLEVAKATPEEGLVAG